MSMCRVFFCVVGRGYLLWPVRSLGKKKKKAGLCPAPFCTPRPNLPVTSGVSWLLTFAFQSPITKRHLFWGVGSIFVLCYKNNQQNPSSLKQSRLFPLSCYQPITVGEGFCLCHAHSSPPAIKAANIWSGGGCHDREKASTRWLCANN